MFTSCYDALGIEHQIKCGNDECEHFRIGDYVKSHIIGDHYESGYLLDDVYQAYGNGFDGCSMVIIKKCRLHAVIYPDKITENEYKEFGIRRASKFHWSKEVFQKHQQAQEKAKLEREEYKKQVKPNLISSQQLAAMLIAPLKTRMNYASMARELFRPPTPEEEAEYARKQAIEAAKPVLNKYDVIKIISELNLQGRNPRQIVKSICQALNSVSFTDFLVYAYPEGNDIDLVLSLYLNKEFQLFQCPLSTMVKGFDAIYQVFES